MTSKNEYRSTLQKIVFITLSNIEIQEYNITQL